MYSYDFRATGYPFRLHSGTNVLDRLPDEVARLKAGRAFIVCGRTVSRKTPLIARMRQLLGERLAGVFDEIDKDTSRSSVTRAVAAARTARADLVIAVGAGSVIQGARILTILLAEDRPVEQLVTQYPEHGPAVSPKLLAPKLPIINVLTAPTTAQNRAGSRMKDDDTARGLEFFDPRTRPTVIFWDTEALLTAPLSLIRTGAATIWCRAVMNLGALEDNPLVAGDRLQAYRLAAGALPRIADARDAGPRFDLCAATLLQNREADDGGGPVRHWVSRVVYAYAASLFNMHEQVSQGAAHCAMTPAVMRRLGSRDPGAMCAIAKALGVWKDGDPVAEAPFRAAEELEKVFASIGMPTSLSQLEIPRSSAEQILASSLKNFNADPKQEFVREKALLREVLDATW